MSVILIISIFLLALTAFAALRTKRSPSKQEPDYRLPPPPLRGLFDGQNFDQPALPSPKAAPSKDPATEFGARLRERAAQGEPGVLLEAQAAGDAALYRELLGTLTARRAASAEELRDLAAYVVGHEYLRASAQLAARLLGYFEQSPSPSTAAQLLRVAALSDDVATFRRTVETVLRAWRRGGLSGVSGEDLRALIESEYWMLSPDAKRSGAGFVLKQELAELRRWLSAEPRPGVPPTTGAGRRTAAPDTEVDQ